MNNIERRPTGNNGGEGAYWFSIWLGAIFFYFWHGRKIPFDDLHVASYQRKNAWTGWAIQMILLAIAIGVFAWVYSHTYL